ncbi:hypothetical protein [Desulfosarcina ovata]|uniref:Uncharacterized protein n=1 Tax=Desulfosarcina ovata subsp. ovata TaxID=2752305 RepID=A0A5K8A3R5_9BACT|nr:hypothetical protein [Desulfosarcina ovata]BBO87233.1 hypothetical protein DSCOOX_04130 [Desulfosarcina ovata subsp. ovata]
MDIIDVYEKVTEKSNLARCQIRITSKTIDDHQTLLEELNRFNAAEGWLCYQSKVVKLSEGTLPDDREDNVLFGELAKENRSLHIRQRKAGWLISEIVSSPARESTVEREQCIAKIVSYSLDQNEFADYEVFWEKEKRDANNDHGFNGEYFPKSYRFVGFRSGKESS